MPTQQTYYLNCTSLATATSVFLDAGMTVCAPDGYYFDGTTARQQVGCALLPAETCPICGTQCTRNIDEALSFEGYYYIPFFVGDTTLDTGAIIININLDDSVGGVLVNFGGTYYNAVSSPIHGYLAGTPSNDFTYLGDNDYDCGIEGSTYTLDNYQWEPTTSSYTNLGVTSNVTVNAPQMQITASDPGTMVMVIPKTSTTPDFIDIYIVGPCPSSRAYVNVSCPVKLPSFASTSVVFYVAPEIFCNFPYNFTYYVAPVNGDGITLGLYDWVFSDENGATVLVDGYYRSPAIPTPYDTFEVQNGVIVAFHSYCAA